MNDEPQHKHRKYYILALFAVFIAILGVILPETEFTPKQYINASNITVVGAASVSGNVSNLSDINTGFVNISESTTPFHADINFTNVTHFSFPEIKARYFSTTATPSTHVVDIEIWCEVDQAFDDLKDLSNHEEWQYFTRHIPDFTHFIKPDGNVTIRLNHTANGNVNHRLYIDTARLITSVQYEQNNIVLNQYFNTTGTGTGSQNLSQVLSVGNISNQTMNMNFHNISNTSEFVNYGNGGTAINFTVNRSYTGTANSITRFAQSSSPILFTVTGNDLTGGYNFRVNMNPDQSQQDTTKAGWAMVMKPFDGSTGSRFQINRGIPRTTTLEGLIDIWSNNTIYLGDSGAVNKNTTVVITNLTGTGNAYVCVDSTGKLFRGSPGC